ncbi:band 7 protein [Candidatus Parcubacteria bacterium]|nr:MAG: band 7 protein [Candidatus Parcubacteria bacterium]
MRDKKNLIPILIFIAIFILPSILANRFLLMLTIFIVIIYLIFKKSNNLINKNMSQTINIDPISGAIKGTKKVIGTVILVLAIIIFLINAVRIIDAGETGVYSLFGKVKDNEVRSGIHVINPFAKITTMSIRTEEYTMSVTQGEGKISGADAITSLTKEGLSVDLDMTVLYRVQEEKASDIYKNVGLNFENKILRPSIRTSIRDVIAQYEAKDIYSEKRQEAAEKIKENLIADLEPRGIIVEDVLLRNVALPANLANAIQEKLQAEQEAQKYEFILQREEKEKERKIIEAEGQRDAQKIINESLSTNYLYYLYINELKDREGTIYVPTGNTTGVPLFRNLGN